MVDVSFPDFVNGLALDTTGGSEKIAVVDVSTSKHVTPDTLKTYILAALTASAAITPTTGDALIVERAGTEGTFDIDALADYIVDYLEAITTGTVIVSGDTVVYSDGGVLKQINIDAIVAFINSENGTLGAQIAALSTAVLADADEYILSQSGTAAKATFTAIAARVHAQFLAYLGTLAAVTAIVDANTIYVNQGGTAKSVTAAILGEYMLAEIKGDVLASAWDDFAALGGVAAATDVFLLERVGVGKTVTGANLASYVIGTQNSASAATPTAGDDFLMFRAGTEFKADVDLLGTYIHDTIWASASGNPVVDADEVAIGRSGNTLVVTALQLQTYVLTGVQATALDLSGLSAATLTGTDLFAVDVAGTAKKTTLTALETKLWTDFDARVAALTAVVTPLDADIFYTIQGGVAKKVTADVFASYIDDELWGDAAALTPALAGDDLFVRRAGTSYAMDIDVLATYVNTSVQAAVLTFSGLAAAVPNAADLFALDDAGTAKKITLTNLETKLNADFAIYVAALTENTVATASDKIYCIQSGTPKWVDPDTLATYFDVPNGDVLGPVTTTEDQIPLWDSTNKTLKDGLVTVTALTAGAMTDSQIPTAQAVDEFVSGAGSIVITSLTDLGEAIEDVDLLLMDNGATGTNRKTAFSRVWTYITTKIQALTDKPTAVDADILTIQDSAASFALKELTLTNLFVYITGKIQGLTAKTTPVDADILTIQDSEASNALKELTIANLDVHLHPSLATVAGTGITAGAASYVQGVEKVGTYFKTTIVMDIAGLRSTAAGDIIGVDGTANPCHIGQITAARNGTIFAGRVDCLELPAGSTPDIDFYSATESTGSEDDPISGLTNTQLLNAGSHAADAFKSLTAFPAANEYLYLVAGATLDADYTTGILVFEFWGK